MVAKLALLGVGSDVIVQIAQNVGLLAFACLALHPLLARTDHARRREIVFGVVLGLAVCLVSALPVQLPDGSSVDGRSGPVLFAGFLGGPVGAVLSATIGSVAFPGQGGPLMLYAGAAAGAGVAWLLRRTGAPPTITFRTTLLLLLLSCLLDAGRHWMTGPGEPSDVWIRSDMVASLAASLVSTALVAAICRWVLDTVERTRLAAADISAATRGEIVRLMMANGSVAEDTPGVTHQLTGVDLESIDQPRSERIELQAERRLADVARSIPGALLRKVMHADGTQEIEYLNPSCYAIFGLTNEELTSDPTRLDRLIHDEDRNWHLEVVKNSRSTLVPYRSLYRIVTPMGDLKWLQAHGRPRQIEGGSVEMSVLVLDATEQVVLRKQLETSQKMFFEAQKSDAVGKLTAGVAHDFNNLLAIILGNLELLEIRGGREDDLLISDAITACGRGATLTRQLLSFSRNAVLHPRVIDIGDLLRATCGLLRRTLPATIRIELDVADGLRPIEVDPSLLENAILNLALNARDAMPDGGCLRIAARNVEPEDVDPPPEFAASELGRFVRITVSDNGIGMDARVARRVFEPFYTTKPAGSGSGMGLAMVQGFVRQSMGWISLVSEPDQGSEFSLHFPVSVSEHHVETPGPARPARATGGPSSYHVLLIEDEAQVRRTLRAQIEHLGHRVTEAGDGAAGFLALRADRTIDVVLSDVRMPGDCQGTDLARRVRNEHPNIPVILISGYPVDANSRIANVGGPVHLLEKPVGLAELAAALDHAMSADPAVEIAQV